MSSKTAFWEDGTALELHLSSKKTLSEDKPGMKAAPSSKSHIPEDKPTNVIPDPIGNLYLLSSKQVLCEDSTALRLNSSSRRPPEDI